MDDVLNRAEHPKNVREESLHKLLPSFLSHHFGEWEIVLAKLDKSSRCHLEQRAYHELRIALKLGGHGSAAVKDIIEMVSAAWTFLDYKSQLRRISHFWRDLTEYSISFRDQRSRRVIGRRQNPQRESSSMVLMRQKDPLDSLALPVFPHMTSGKSWFL